MERFKWHSMLRSSSLLLIYSMIRRSYNLVIAYSNNKDFNPLFWMMSSMEIVTFSAGNYLVSSENGVIGYLEVGAHSQPVYATTLIFIWQCFLLAPIFVHIDYLACAYQVQRKKKTKKQKKKKKKKKKKQKKKKKKKKKKRKKKKNENKIKNLVWFFFIEMANPSEKPVFLFLFFWIIEIFSLFLFIY